MEYKKCPKCGKQQGYFRSRTADYRCVSCAHVWKEELEEVGSEGQTQLPAE